MAAANRSQAIDLIRKVEANPFAFDFFRAVRLVENHCPDLPRVGGSISFRDDSVRFKQNPSLAFATSTNEAFDAGDDKHPPALHVNFLGLSGPNGPMPLHVSEYAHDRQYNAHDRAMTAFFDVFHQRMLSLFYRAWAVNQKSVDLDRPRSARFPEYIGSLFGLGMESLRNRDEVPDWAKLHFSGRLVCQTRNAEGLGAILEDYFGMPTTIQTFFGHWLDLPENSLCRLGASPDTGSLGTTTIVGSRFWDCQLKFRIRFGPMTLSRLQTLLPGTDAFRKLKAWVRNYAPFEYLWDAQFVLAKEEVPATRLGESSRLGWTTWVTSKPFERDAEDLVLNPELI
jgi:type VI secretion system protein ImpH